MRSTHPHPLPAQRPLEEPAAATAPCAPLAPAHRSAPPRRLSSTQLLDGATEVEIEHRGAMYRLRLTSLDKLILTK